MSRNNVVRVGTNVGRGARSTGTTPLPGSISQNANQDLQSLANSDPIAAGQELDRHGANELSALNRMQLGDNHHQDLPGMGAHLQLDASSFDDFIEDFDESSVSNGDTSLSDDHHMFQTEAGYGSTISLADNSSHHNADDTANDNSTPASSSSSSFCGNILPCGCSHVLSRIVTCIHSTLTFTSRAPEEKVTPTG